MTAAGQADEFLALLSPIRDALFRFAVRSTWRRDHAADIVQEAIMVAWRQFDRFERGTNFRAWMFKILLNTAYRVNRKTHRSREVRFETDAIEVADLMEREEIWPSVLERPEWLMESLDDRVVQSLSHLAPMERQCFLLRLLEDFSYKEIAEQLDLPIGTVMSHVYRARMKLRERLAGLAVEQGFARSNDESSD